MTILEQVMKELETLTEQQLQVPEFVEKLWREQKAESEPPAT